MAKKRYPVVSILIAIIWAVFFYPQDRTSTPPTATTPASTVPQIAATQPAARTPAGQPHIGPKADHISAFAASGDNAGTSVLLARPEQ